MRKLDSILAAGLLAVAVAPLYWEEFPAMAALYALMTVLSVLYGLECWLEPGTAAAWQRRAVPPGIQRRWARRLGRLFFLNAAVCPLGWLLALLVPFDTDFILLTQIIGFFLISLLSLLPRCLAGRGAGT